MVQSFKLLCWLTILAASCSPQMETGILGPEEHSEILAVALDTALSFNGLHWERQDTILLLDSTVVIGGAALEELMAGERRDEFDEMLDAMPEWIRRAILTDAPQHLVSLSSTGRTAVRAVSSEEISDYFDTSTDTQDAWAAWDSDHPGTHGWIGASAAFVGSERGDATIYVELHCGPLCGSGVFLRVALADGVWTIRDVAPMWVS